MPSRVNISPYRSPVLNRVLARSAGSSILASCLAWGLLNLIVAVCLAFDVTYGAWLTHAAAQHLGPVLQTAVTCAEYVLCGICSVNVLVHAFRFGSIPVADVTMTTGPSQLLKQAPGSGALVADLHRDGANGCQQQQHATAVVNIASPGLPIAPMGNLGSGYISSTPRAMSYRSGGGCSGAGGRTPDSHASNGVRKRRTVSSSSSTPSSYRLPLGGDGSIADLQSLTEYLHTSPLSVGSDSSFESLNMSSANGSSLYASSAAYSGFSPVQTSPGMTAAHHDMTTRDFSPLSARYQVASRPPSSQHSSPVSPAQDGACHHKKYLTDVWLVQGVERDMLDFWTEKCRRWLARAIVQPLAVEIETLNKSLKNIGCVHLQLGQADSHAVQKVGLGDAMRQLPNLSLVLKYLDLCSNQDYLVWRVKELARGTCLSSFRWDGGGRVERGDWDSSLPTDAAIVFHLFCTYMDSCLPPSPRIPDRRTFTLQYVKPLSAAIIAKETRTGAPMTTAAATKSSTSSPPRKSGGWLGSMLSSHLASTLKSTADRDGDSSSSAANLAHLSDNLHFVQSGERPPHYQLAINGKTVDVGAGRNNLFHSMLYFLYHVKNVERGMLGSVNLPLAGLDILSVVADV
ncbi:transmembrane protein 209-like [Sycon ciliatum]|uniref:transmembrane protein 209-like n=1 Tax=Sycon ciliatum TaxID=27933 RepID=UPI0020AAD903|eukprot:scpid34810/ scgid10312/ Transmembrane protein 209